MTATELRQVHAATIAKMRALNNSKRNFDEADQRQYDGWQTEVDALQTRIARAETLERSETELAQPVPVARDAQGNPVQIPGAPIMGGDRAAAPGRILRHDQHLVDRITPPDGIKPDDLSFDRWLRASLTGDWKQAEAELALQRTIEVGSSPGSLTVPSILSAQVLDAVRAASVVSQAGARTVPIGPGETGLVRLDSDPAAAWYAESESASFTDPDFSVVKFQPKTLAVFTKLSLESWEDGLLMEDTIRRSLAASLASELDRAGLLGAGTDSEPTGIFDFPGVIQVDGEDASVTLAHFLDLIYRLRAINVTNPLQAVYAPLVGKSLNSMTDSTGQPLRMPPGFTELRRFETSKISVANDQTRIFVGDFTECVIGLRSNLMLEVSREAAAGNDSAFLQRQIWVRAILRADIVLQRSHFAVAFDIDPTWVLPA